MTQLSIHSGLELVVFYVHTSVLGAREEESLTRCVICARAPASQPRVQGAKGTTFPYVDNIVE